MNSSLFSITIQGYRYTIYADRIDCYAVRDEVLFSAPFKGGLYIDGRCIASETGSPCKEYLRDIADNMSEYAYRQLYLHLVQVVGNKSLLS